MATQDPGTRLADIACISAELMVKKTGSFPPFGIGIDRNGKHRVYAKNKEGNALLTIETAPLAMRDDFRAGRIVAAAIVAIVQASPAAGKSPRDVIATQIEVPGNPAGVVVLGRTFRKGLFGWKFGDPFVIANPIAARVVA